MSADDFQSKYASVMESMLKSAIAETTKLFENMVDELKAEISQIKKENEDLKTKCFQYETAKTKPVAQTGEGEPGDASVKCDTAVQCDLVPFRTIVVEQCEPLINTGPVRQDQEYSYEYNNHSLLEHDYVGYQDRTTPMELVVVKKESELKREDDPDLACKEVLDVEIGSCGASVGQAEIGEHCISDSSTEHITVPQENTSPVVLQLSSFGTDKSQMTQNQSADIQHSLVISLKDALRDDFKEESEIIEVSKPATTRNKKTALVSASVSTEVAGDEINDKDPEDGAKSKTVLTTGRRRGRPPKKSRQQCDKGSKHQMDLKDQLAEKEPIDKSPTLVTETPHVINSPIEEGKSTSIVECLSGNFSSREHSTLQFQGRDPRIVKSATVDKKPNDANGSSDISPQASLGLLKACQSTVSLQDALLLVEAMNQSTMEKSVTPLKVPSPSQVVPGSASSVGSFKTSKTTTSNQAASVKTQRVSTQTSLVSDKLTDALPSKEVDLGKRNPLQPSHLSAPLNCSASSAVSTRTAVQSLPSTLDLKAPNKVPRKIIILPRPTHISDDAKAGSQTPSSAVKPATLNKRNLPPSTAADLLPCETPALSSVRPKTIKVVYRKQDPFTPSQSITILNDHQYVAPQTSIVSKQMSSGMSKEPGLIDLEMKGNNKEPLAPSTQGTSKQLISEVQGSTLCLSDNETLEKVNLTDNLNSSAEMTSTVESKMVPGQKQLGSELLFKKVQPSVSPLPQGTERKFIAVVRLTRLPLSISTKESVLISELLSKGIIKETPSTAHLLEEHIDFNLHSPGPSTPGRLTPDFDLDEDSVITRKDKADPHARMSKVQFLAKLAVSPLENEPKDNENSTSKETKSIVSRLRSHLQAHFEAKRRDFKMPRSGRHGAGSKHINDSTSKSSKSSLLNPKMFTKVDSSPERSKSSANENGSRAEMSGTPSCSTSPKSKSRMKSMKRESSSLSPRGYIGSAEESITEMTKSEPESPSPKQFKMAKNDRMQMTAESNPKGQKQLEVHPGNRFVNDKKLTNATKGNPKGRRVGKKRGNYKKRKFELPVIQSGVVKKCRAKVWYPPTLPPNEKPITDIIRKPPLKVEYRIPDIPYRAPPIVSPLQPLAVIGRHLLRNQCGECGRVFTNSNALETHVSLHKVHRPFSCKLCGKYFPDSKTFKRHDRVHRNGRIHVCQHCGKGFVYRFGLSKHIQMVHSRIRPFICQVCGNGFYTKRDVEIHIRIHTGEKPFQCHICERRFTRKVELNVHLRWHNGEKRHWCQYCGKGFLDYNNLKRHRYIHTGEKPYSCTHCPKKFTQTGHLKKHVRDVHKIK